MSITGSGTISSSLDSPGLIWTSYNDYFNLNVNFFSTASTFSGPITPSNGPLTYTTTSNTNYYSYFRLITNKIQAGASGDAVVQYSDWRLTGYVSAI